MSWWHGAVGYEVYVRSFADSDGDGVGDLPGVRSRLGHLADLGVDLVWLTPFYPSPQADHGYDVADHRDVDPMFGTLDDFDALISDAHDRDLRVMVDVVPNHTSDRHPWFQASRSSRDDPKRDWYVWRDPAPDGGPPNNWVSHFGGPAWTLDETTGQYYLHLFLPEQPDLNWREPAVADAFDDILRFWLERGVDGFRIDVAHALLKHEELPDNPLKGASPRRGTASRDVFGAYDHRHDLDQPEVLDVYRRWRRVVEPYGAVLLGEVYLLEAPAVARYVRDQRGLHLALYIPTTKTTWDAGTIRSTLRDGIEHGGAHFAWPVASHDDPHPATRFGGGEEGRERSLAFLTLVMGMPGLVFLFQGDELGLEDGHVPPEAAQDPVSTRNPGDPGGRDGVRVPMPWEPGTRNLGFTTGTPWLPMTDRRDEHTVTAQRARSGSALRRVRDLVSLRRDLEDLALDRPVEWLTEAGPLVAYRRGGTIVAANCGSDRADLTLPAGEWRVLFASDRGTTDGQRIGGDTLRVAPGTAVVLAR